MQGSPHLPERPLPEAAGRPREGRRTLLVTVRPEPQPRVGDLLPIASTQGAGRSRAAGAPDATASSATAPSAGRPRRGGRSRPASPSQQVDQQVVARRGRRRAAGAAGRARETAVRRQPGRVGQQSAHSGLTWLGGRLAAAVISYRGEAGSWVTRQIVRSPQRRGSGRRVLLVLARGRRTGSRRCAPCR